MKKFVLFAAAAVLSVAPAFSQSINPRSILPPQWLLQSIARQPLPTMPRIQPIVPAYVPPVSYQSNTYQLGNQLHTDTYGSDGSSYQSNSYRLGNQIHTDVYGTNGYNSHSNTYRIGNQIHTDTYGY